MFCAGNLVVFTNSTPVFERLLTGFQQRTGSHIDTTDATHLPNAPSSHPTMSQVETDCFRLGRHEMFRRLREALPSRDGSNAAQNLLECREDMLFAWNPTECCVLALNWRAAYITEASPVAFQVSANHITSTHSVHSIGTPELWGGHWAGQRFVCKCVCIFRGPVVNHVNHNNVDLGDTKGVIFEHLSHTYDTLPTRARPFYCHPLLPIFCVKEL